MNYTYKLSICMMVRDEESNINRCLDSLKPLIESKIAELIVIDTGSKDSTPEMVKEYTDKLFFHTWNDNFSDMRNISISYASGEWIFIIDADERLDDPQGFIDLFLKSNLEKYNTIQLYIRNLYSIKNEKNYNQNISPRIFKNDGSFYYQGSVHNQPIMKEPCLSFDLSLTHYGYISNDKKLMDKKYYRTVSLLKKELQLNPNNIYYLYQLGVSYDMHNEHKNALEEFRKAYKLLSSQPINIRKNYINVYGSYIRAAYTNHEYEEVNKIGAEALALNKEYIDIYYILSLNAKQTHNQEALIHNCLEYEKLNKVFNSLDISKNYSVIMYHIDDQSKDFIYTELSLYYINENQLNIAYEYAKKIMNENHNICLTIKILVKKYDFYSLKNYYINKIKDDQKESFLSTLEEEITSLSEDKRDEFYKEFHDLEDIYGMFCEARLLYKKNNISCSLELLKKIDLNYVPLFYAEVLINLRGQKEIIFNTLRGVNRHKVRNIVKLLINKDDTFIKIFEQYLLTENIRKTDLQANKVFISVADILLLNRVENSEEIDPDYYSIFKFYINSGINYVSQIYQIQKSRIIYNDITNEEDRFFILMNIVNENIARNNFNLAIKYMIESVKSFKYMAKYLDKYKEELFCLFTK